MKNNDDCYSRDKSELGYLFWKWRLPIKISFGHAGPTTSFRLFLLIKENQSKFNISRNMVQFIPGL